MCSYLESYIYTRYETCERDVAVGVLAILLSSRAAVYKYKPRYKRITVQGYVATHFAGTTRVTTSKRIARKQLDPILHTRACMALCITR